MQDFQIDRPVMRLTGALYLLIAASGFFSILYVPSQLHVAGNGAETLANIAARPGLFGLGILGDVTMMTAEVAVSVMLFQMFRRAGETVALVAMVARLLMAATMAAMLLFQGAVWHLATAELPGAAGLVELVLFAHDSGVWVWQVFFALHLVLLGVLVARSGLFPRLLGIALSIGGIAYAFDSLRAVAMPGSDAMMVAGGALLAVATLAEIGFAVMLLLARHGGRTGAVRETASGRATA